MNMMVQPNSRDIRTTGKGVHSTLIACLLLWFTFNALAETPNVIASFENDGSETNWISVNDGVMGGISKGTFKRTDNNSLLFFGELSLENNGGFASIRTKPRDMNLDGTNAIVVKARGDGRTYWLDIRTSGQMAASSYRAYMPTEKDKVTETSVSLSQFKLQAFGRDLPGKPLIPAEITSIGFTLADKIAGPFQLEIFSISATKDAEEAGGEDTGTIVDVARKAGTFKTLLAAAKAAGLVGALSGDGPFTVFAPTDEAFAKLPEGMANDLLKPENKERLAALLKYHVISGKITLVKALEVGKGTTLQGKNLTAKFSDGRVRIGEAILIHADITASNGIIHVIDQVLMPPDPSADQLSAVAIVELAIERGVPLFNSGDVAGCAAVYEVTCEALRKLEEVPEASKKDLTKALATMREQKAPTEKAWTLRYALDRFLKTRQAK